METKALRPVTTLIVVAILILLGAVGCATPVPRGDAPPPGVRVVSDPRGNLKGDATRAFMDIVQTKIWAEGDYYVFEVEAAAPFPARTEMRNGKRFDFIWFVDHDMSRGTGQSADGNDYNIHLFLDESGWHSGWMKVSDLSKRDGIAIDGESFHIRVDGARARLIFPKRYLARVAFEWWAMCTSTNARNWDPLTENPNTARTVHGL